MRTDTTSVAAPIRAPLGSALLSDSVRVLAELLKQAQKWIPTEMPNHRRRVTHRSTSLRAPKVSPEDRKTLYADLMDDTKIYVETALFAATYLEGIDDPNAYLLSLNLRIQAVRALCIVDQTERRIIDGEALSFAKNWCRSLDRTPTFCASETVSCTDTKSVYRLAERDWCWQRRGIAGIQRTRR